MTSIDRWKGTKWRARYRAPDGSSRSKIFHRKIDAERFLTSIEHSKLVGAYTDPSAGRLTIAEYWNVWSTRQPWRDSSRLSVTSLFDRHVLPALGARPLNTIRRGDIETWAAKLPLARQSARHAVSYLSTLLEAAVADGFIARNPAQGAKTRVDDQPVVPFTTTEIEALRTASPDSFAVALTLGLGAGLRQSEATGLTVDRIDFLRRTLTIDRQLVTPKAGEPTLGPPKTPRSYRTVPLADAVLEELARHLARFEPGHDGLLLHGLDGRPIRRQTFGSVWRQLRTRAGLPQARFHGTRHTFASTLLSGGVGVAAAAEYLGHSPAVLLSTYAHLLPGDHDRARAVVQAASTRPRLRRTGPKPGRTTSPRTDRSTA